MGKKIDCFEELTRVKKERLLKLSDEIAAAVLEILYKEEPLTMDEGLTAMAAGTISILDELANTAGLEKRMFKARYCVSLLL